MVGDEHRLAAATQPVLRKGQDASCSPGAESVSGIDTRQNGSVAHNGTDMEPNGHVRNGRASRKFGSLWWDEVPRVLQFNDWIASGYRANLSYSQCVCTLFSVHNETGNIWLHFGPSFIIWALLLGWLRDSNALHFAAFMRLIIPALACLLLSTGYHLFMAQVKHYRFWLTADVCGIFSMFVVPFFTFTWWGYRCQPHLRAWVTSAYYVGAASAVLAGILAKNKTARAAPMGLLSVFRLSSLAYRYYLNTSSREGILHSVLAEILCFAGATINVLRIPERWLHVRQPKSGHRKAQLLDLWGNSHQIMHLLTALAIFNMYWTLEYDAKYMNAHPSCSF